MNSSFSQLIDCYNNGNDVTYDSHDGFHLRYKPKSLLGIIFYDVDPPMLSVNHIGSFDVQGFVVLRIRQSIGHRKRYTPNRVIKDPMKISIV